MTADLTGNIWKYCLILIANKRIFAPILGAYYLTIPDVTANTIGIILMVGSLSAFLFEIPSGFLADKLGHKQIIVFSRLLMLIATILFLISDSVPLLIAAGIFFSASFAFFSGTGSAFMHDTLRALGREKDYAAVMGKISSLGFAIPIVLMVTVPFLVSISYAAPFIISLITDTIGLIAALLLKVPPVAESEVAEVKATNFVQVMQEGWRLHFFSIVLFTGTLSGFLFAVGGFRAPYQVLLEIPVIWFGVLFGLGRAGASILLVYSGRLKAYFNLLSFFRFQIILYGVLILALGITTNWILVALIFIVMNAFQWGFSQIDEAYRLSIIRNSKFKATLLSAGSQVKHLADATTAFGLGYLIQKTSYQEGFFWIGLLFISILIMCYVYIAKKFNAGMYENLPTSKP